jgi:hypothetical protein
MFVMFTFKTQIGDKTVESPVMGSGDMDRLRNLFPKNPVWGCSKSDMGNQMFPTVEEMKSLYDDLVEYFAKNIFNNEEYQTGNFTGSFAIVSSLRSMFQDIIRFCEQQLGFKRPESLAADIAQREAFYLQEKMDAREKERAEVLSFFGKLPHIKKPEDADLVARLQQKLAEYRLRLEDTYRHPDLAFMVEPTYRDATYKIEVLSALLALDNGKELDLCEMVKRALEQRKDHFFGEEYFNACAVIAHYVGQPFEGSDIQKELPKVV